MGKNINPLLSGTKLQKTKKIFMTQVITMV